jgi:hypothetical protein
MKFIMEIESKHESKAVHFRNQYNFYPFKFLGVFFGEGNSTYLSMVLPLIFSSSTYQSVFQSLDFSSRWTVGTCVKLFSLL